MTDSGQRFRKTCARLSSLVASPVAQTAKRLPVMQETQVQSLGQEDPLEKEMATHSSILAWRIPCIVKSMGLPRVRHTEKLSLSLSYIYIYTQRNHSVVFDAL